MPSAKLFFCKQFQLSLFASLYQQLKIDILSQLSKANPINIEAKEKLK